MIKWIQVEQVSIIDKCIWHCIWKGIYWLENGLLIDSEFEITGEKYLKFEIKLSDLSVYYGGVLFDRLTD